MASTRSCGCRFRSSFSLFVQSPIHSILFAITFAATALGQVTNSLGAITSQPLPITGLLVTTQPLAITSQPAVVTAAPTIPVIATVTANSTAVTVAPPIPSGSNVTSTTGSNQVSKISVFITVTSASSTPAATSPSNLPSATKPGSKKSLGVGIGLGVPALCLLIILAIWLIIRHFRKKRASGGGNSPFIAELGSEPKKNNQESELPSELPDSKPALRELPEGRENSLPRALRTELPTNSAPLAEMRGS